MKKLLLLCFIAVSSIVLVSCQKSQGKSDTSNIAENIVDLEPITTTSKEISSWSTDDNMQDFEVELSNNGTMYEGVESWEEGKEIIFNITSEKNLNLQIGLMKVIDEDKFEFGEIISEDVEIKDGEGKVCITVPKTEKYAIYIKNVGEESVKFTLNLDTPLKTPLV